MPDHVHILLRALTETATLTRMLPDWKQRVGFSWSRRSGEQLWQKGYWERVLRSGDDEIAIARYIVENPVRAGLVSDPRSYPWLGSTEYSLESILTAVQMDGLRRR